MDNCYHNAQGGDDFPELDEWLCEYVDGTLDPVIRGALEEYMHANPDLAAHVERLAETRRLLGQYGCSHKAPCSLQSSLRQRLAGESPRHGISSTSLIRATTGLGFLATCASVVAILMLFGVMSNSNIDSRFVQDTMSGNSAPPTPMAAPKPMTAAVFTGSATPIARMPESRFYRQFVQHRPQTLRFAHLTPVLRLPARANSTTALPLELDATSLITSP